MFPEFFEIRRALDAIRTRRKSFPNGRMESMIDGEYSRSFRDSIAKIIAETTEWKHILHITSSERSEEGRYTLFVFLPEPQPDETRYTEAGFHVYHEEPERFYVGDIVRIPYITDRNPYNNKHGVITWLNDYKYWPDTTGDLNGPEMFHYKTQAIIQYSNGAKFMVDDLYYKGSGLVSKVIKEGRFCGLEIAQKQ